MDFFHYQTYPPPPPVPQQSIGNDRLLMDPRLNSAPTNSQAFYRGESLSLKIDKENQQHLIDTWLLEKGKLQSPFIPPAQSEESVTTAKPITISGARVSMKNCMVILEKITRIHEELRCNVATMPRTEWKQKTQDITDLKDEFNKLITKFEDDNVLNVLKKMLKRREKRRKNTSKRKRAKRERFASEAEERAKCHKEIDRWLETMKEDAEKAKMEERLKKDADCVLYEVTKKKSDARKQLALVSALAKLRAVRDQMATHRGERVSLEDRNAFVSVTEKLMRMWETASNNYAKEEQCLKMMLQHNASEGSKAARTAKELETVRTWESILFGPDMNRHNSNPTYFALTSADRDMETFVAIRRSWDTFLTNTSSGSAIPIGWAIPPDNPRSDWSAHANNSAVVSGNNAFNSR